MGRSRGARRSWWHRIFTSRPIESRQRRRRGRRRDHHQNQPAYWQGLAALEPRLMMSVTGVNIVPLAPSTQEAQSVTFTGVHDAAQPVNPTWAVSKLTDTPSGPRERFVAVSGNRTAWSTGQLASPHEDVLYNDGTTTINLSAHIDAGAYAPVFWGDYVAFVTNTGVWLDNITNTAPAQQIGSGSGVEKMDMDAGRIVWQNSTVDSHIRLYDIATQTTQIISNSMLPAELNPDISGDKVVWMRLGGDSVPGGTFPADIILYDLNTQQEINLSQLGGGDGDAKAPRLADGRAIWSNGATEVFYYDGSAVHHMTPNTSGDHSPVISNTHAAWLSIDGRVTVFDIAAGPPLTNQPQIIASGAAFPQDLRIDGNNLAWSQRVSTRFEVFFHEIGGLNTSPSLLSTAALGGGADSGNQWDDTAPAISGRNVAWVGKVGGDSGNEEVFFAKALGGEVTYQWSVMLDDQQVDLTGVVTDQPQFSFTPADDGAYTVTFTVTDPSDNTSASVSTSLAVTNVAPSVQITGGPGGDVNEGSAVNFSFSGGDPAGDADPLSFNWAVLKDGNAYASGVGTNVSFTPDDNGTYEVSATADDGDGGITSATQVVNVINVAPVIDSLTVPAQAVRGQSVTVSAALDDLGVADTHTTIWQVLDSANTLIASGSGSNFAFTALDLGSYTVQFTVTDDDGGGDTQSAVLHVVVAALAADPLNAGHMVLTIGGTAGNDHLYVRERDGLFEVLFSSQFHGSFALANGDRIQVLGYDGHDWIRVDSPAGISVEASGGAGTDWIRTGDGDDIILGGDGDDLLFGNGGRDLLIGEAGNDLILGNSEDDILIGGHYVQSGDRAALLAISAAWSSSLAYLDRIGVITSGVASGGAPAPGGIYRLDVTTLLDDGTTDILLGLQGADWFAGHSDNDITDSRTSEMLTDTQYTFVTAV